MAPKKKKVTNSKSKKIKSKELKGKSTSKMKSKTKISKSKTKEQIEEKAPIVENPWRSVFDIHWVSFGGAEKKKEVASLNEIPHVEHHPGSWRSPLPPIHSLKKHSIYI